MRRGWCPTVYAPMASGDGLLVRVKPPCGRLDPPQARALAAAAARDGNGAIELTSRANLQVRGLSPATAPRFAAAMVDAELAGCGPGVERRRNVAINPLSGTASFAVAAELEGLLADARLAALPDKFGFAVALPGIGADVRLHAHGGVWLVWPDGATATAVSGDPAADALRLARAFLAVAPGAARMRAADPAAVFAAAGLRATAPVPVLPVPRVIGALPGGFGVGLPFGATNAAALAALAELGTLRLTPWRAFVIDPTASSPDPLPLKRRNFLGGLGLITDPADPRLGVFACPGRPACASAHADVRADAARLARLRPGIDLHVSGCAKGCAHRARASVTLVARADGYALIRNGAAADPPGHTALTLDQAAAMLAP